MASSPSLVAETAARINDSVVAVHQGDRTGIVVRGKDRASWLNGLLTCDLARLTAGTAAYGLIVEKKGRIQSDVFVVPSAPASESFALAVPCSVQALVFETLDHYLVMEDAEFEAVDLDVWLLHGPKASEVASRVAAPFAGTVNLLGVGGAVLAVPRGEAEGFRACLKEAVAAAGGSLTDDAGFEPVRIERGLPRFGVEVDASLYPQEASLEGLAVSFDKGCYLGQEVLYMLQHRGHAKRKLVPLVLEGDKAVEVRAPVCAPDGTEVGEVRSFTVGPSSGRPVAIAMVKWSLAKPGTELRVDGRPAHVRDER